MEEAARERGIQAGPLTWSMASTAAGGRHRPVAFGRRLQRAGAEDSIEMKRLPSITSLPKT